MSIDPTLQPQETPAPHKGRGPSTSREVEALLIPADVAGPLCGLSEATWWRLHAAEKVPVPVKLGKRTLWRRDELTRWIAAGCPSRAAWFVLEKTGRKDHSRG